MIINYKKREIQIKIVYYGCAMSGKTTSLRSLFRVFNKENLVTSINTTTGRTLILEFCSLKEVNGRLKSHYTLQQAKISMRQLGLQLFMELMGLCLLLILKESISKIM